jgi:hypothetical protein
MSHLEGPRHLLPYSPKANRLINSCTEERSATASASEHPSTGRLWHKMVFIPMRFGARMSSTTLSPMNTTSCGFALASLSAASLAGCGASGQYRTSQQPLLYTEVQRMPVAHTGKSILTWCLFLLTSIMLLSLLGGCEREPSSQPTSTESGPELPKAADGELLTHDELLRLILEADECRVVGARRTGFGKDLERIREGGTG